MDSLLRIAGSLKEGEISLIRHFYNLKKREKGEQKKRHLLFELLLKGKITDENEAARAVGYPGANVSFSNLKSRLRSDILNVMLLQESSQKFSTPYAQAQFECRRALLQGELLMSRGVYDEAVDLLTKNARLAGRYELHAEQLIIEDLIRNHAAMRESAQVFENISDSIEDGYKKMGEVLRAKRRHYEVTAPRLLRVQSLDEYSIKGSEVLQRLEEADQRCASSKIKLYHHLASLNYYTALRDFEKAEAHALSLLERVESDPVIRSNANKAGVSMELANICLNTGRNEAAVQYATNAVELFKPGMLNQLHASIILFFSYFRQDKLDESERVLKEMQRHRIVRQHMHPGMNARVQLLQAGLAFRLGDLDGVTEVVRESGDLIRHADNWMPGYFLLDTLTTIEKRAFDVADYRLEAFRKTIHRHGYDKEERRIGLIIKLMRGLLRCRCNVRRLLDEHEGDVQLLAEGKAPYCWNPAGYELIRFDKWLMAKAS